MGKNLFGNYSTDDMLIFMCVNHSIVNSRLSLGSFTLVKVHAHVILFCVDVTLGMVSCLILDLKSMWTT